MSLTALWKLYTEFSIHQAALLLAGHDPQDYEDVDHHKIPTAAKGYSVARDAIVHAVEVDRLEAARAVWDDPEFGGPATLNVYGTLISVVDLDAFVKAHGMICEAFARSDLIFGPNFSASSPNLPQKLAAANKAWAAVASDPTLSRGKSPKQALAKWLTDHAAELGLLNKDGTPNRTGIEEICKVANWKPGGGATPTAVATTRVPAPTAGLTPTPPVQAKAPQAARRRETFDLDDEIPF